MFPEAKEPIWRPGTPVSAFDHDQDESQQTFDSFPILPIEIQKMVFVEYFRSITICPRIVDKGCSDWEPVDEDKAARTSDDWREHGRWHLKFDSDPDPVPQMRRVKVSYHELDVKKRRNLTKVQCLFPKDARVAWESHVLFEFVDLEEMLDVVCAPPFNKQRSLIKRAQIDKSACKWYQTGVILLEDIFWSL